jgi:hypothetical protein
MALMDLSPLYVASSGWLLCHVDRVNDEHPRRERMNKKAPCLETSHGDIESCIRWWRSAVVGSCVIGHLAAWISSINATDRKQITVD